MKNHYDNSDRLEGVTDKEWREALDEVTAYLRWRLQGKTKRGAHCERELGMPALDYYQEEAVVKLIEGDWLWQERFTLGKQLEKIAADLVTKQTQKWLRAHPLLTEDGKLKNDEETVAQQKRRARAAEREYGERGKRCPGARPAAEKPDARPPEPCPAQNPQQVDLSEDASSVHDRGGDHGRKCKPVGFDAFR